MAHNKEISDARTKAKGTGVGLLAGGVAAGYSIGTRVSRFGLRGQDVKDQNALQDKLVNTSLGLIGGAAAGFAVGGVAGGVSALVLSMASTAINEVVSISIANAQYNYNKAYDLDVSGLGRERQGAMAYNYSRRGAF